ncbi:uncharacterized protein ACIB01_012169 [Guaruba guarouba]
MKTAPGPSTAESGFVPLAPGLARVPPCPLPGHTHQSLLLKRLGEYGGWKAMPGPATRLWPLWSPAAMRQCPGWQGRTGAGHIPRPRARGKHGCMTSPALNWLFQGPTCHPEPWVRAESGGRPLHGHIKPLSVRRTRGGGRWPG